MTKYGKHETISIARTFHFFKRFQIDLERENKKPEIKDTKKGQATALMQLADRLYSGLVSKTASLDSLKCEVVLGSRARSDGRCPVRSTGSLDGWTQRCTSTSADSGGGGVVLTLRTVHGNTPR